MVIVSTVDCDNAPHNSCKGIVEIKPAGQVFLLDLYHGQTLRNLMQNQNISITAVDEHKFKGYCLKGAARMLESEDPLSLELIKAWEDRITSRLTQRVLRNLGGQKGHHTHPEFLLPKPKYLIVMEVREAINLTPQHIK